MNWNSEASIKHWFIIALNEVTLERFILDDLQRWFLLISMQPSVDSHAGDSFSFWPGRAATKEDYAIIDIYVTSSATHGVTTDDSSDTSGHETGYRHGETTVMLWEAARPCLEIMLTKKKSAKQLKLTRMTTRNATDPCKMEKKGCSLQLKKYAFNLLRFKRKT